MNFDEARAQFPALERVAYLNAGSMGPVARPTIEAMKARHDADLERGRGGKPYIDEMLALRGQARAALAGVVHVDPRECRAHELDDRGLQHRPRRASSSAPTTRSSRPTASTSGCSARCRPRRRRCASPGSASGRPRTRWRRSWPRSRRRRKLLALSHVSWLTGNLLPIEELREATGLPVLVDGAQSGGAIPVEAARYDFYTVSGQKWLCGPDSTGALYIKDPEALRVARPTYFSQLEHDEARHLHAARGRAALRRRLVPDPVARRSRRRDRARAALGVSPRNRDRRALLRAAHRALPGRDRSRPGDARRRSNRGDRRRVRGTPLRRRASSSATCRTRRGCVSPAAGGRTTAISTGSGSAL